MRRIFFFLLAIGMLLASAGCGGSFLGLSDRQAYLLISPAQLQVVKLKTGALSGNPILLDAPTGIRTICFRSQSGQLYGLGEDKKLYRINGVTGKCFVVSPNPLDIHDAQGTLFSGKEGSKFYYVAQDLSTYSIDPSLGTVTANGTPVAYAAGDPNSGPAIGGAAYTPSGKQLYVVDKANDVLAKMDSPTTGVLHTIGALGVDVAGFSGFSIDPQLGKAYLTCDSGAPGLYSVDLATGAVTQIAGASAGAEGIAVIP